ncbi:MAG: hypothetical protein AAGL24_21755 [Pseudomonadota bacterium]
MLFELQTDSFVIILACILIVAALLGWLADAVLDSAGFGMIGNIILCTLGSVGALYALDYGLASQMVPWHLFTATTCVFAAVLGAAFTTIFATLAKSFVAPA